MRGTVAIFRNVELSPPNAGARLVEQSMGAYMALELAKVMPEEHRGRGGRCTVFRRVPIESPCTETGMCACVVSHWSQ